MVRPEVIRKRLNKNRRGAYKSGLGDIEELKRVFASHL